MTIPHSTTADGVRTPLFAIEDAQAFDRAQHGASVARLLGVERLERLDCTLPQLARMAALELMGRGWIVDASTERARLRGSEAWVAFWVAVEIAGHREATAELAAEGVPW